MAQSDILSADDFAARLLLTLQACNLSRAQLSSILGVNKSLVSRWLSGEMKPSNHNLARISAEVAERKPGFNMSLWTAPIAQFEAALGLSAPTFVALGMVADRSGVTPAPLDRQPGDLVKGISLSGWLPKGIPLYVIGATLTLLLAAVVTVWVGAPGNISDRAEAVRLTQASRALTHERNRSSVAKAEHLLREAVAIDPSYAPAWSWLGYATWFPWWWTEQQDPGAKLRLKAEALAYIKRALAISPQLAEARGIMGVVLTDTNEGIPWLESAVRLDAEDPELWLWLAEGRQGTYDLQGALAAIRKARSLDPAWHRLDEPYLDLIFRLQGPSQAYKELDRMAESMNDQNWAVQERADLEYDEGRLVDSAALAATALRARPQNPYWARNRLVFIASLLGDKSLQDRILAKDRMLRINFNAFRQPGWAYERAQTSPDTWWDGTLIGAQASQLVSEGKSPLLVSLYDRRFHNPTDFLLRCPSLCNAISVAPALVIALRQAGRRTEATRILEGAAGKITSLEVVGDRMFNTELSRARVAALEGDTTTAKQRLRDALHRGWKGQGTGFPDPSSDPAFAVLRGDSEFQALIKQLRLSQRAEAERLAKLDFSGL